MQLSLHKRFSQGLTFRANYTWSKALGDYNPEVVPWFADGSIDRMQYGPLDIDQRHRLVLSWVWELPTVGTENAFVKFVINGWQWSGIGQFQTGAPYEVTSGRDNSLDGIGDDRANSPATAVEPASGPTSASGSTRTPSPATTSARSARLGRTPSPDPSIYSWDMGVFKRFVVTERANVQFRSEFFNVFNQVNFDNPNTNVSGGGFGTITSTHSFAGDPRILQFGLKLAF